VGGKGSILDPAGIFSDEPDPPSPPRVKPPEEDDPEEQERRRRMLADRRAAAARAATGTADNILTGPLGIPSGTQSGGGSTTLGTGA